MRIIPQAKLGLLRLSLATLTQTLVRSAFREQVRSVFQESKMWSASGKEKNKHIRP